MSVMRDTMPRMTDPQMPNWSSENQGALAAPQHASPLPNPGPVKRRRVGLWIAGFVGVITVAATAVAITLIVTDQSSKGDDSVPKLAGADASLIAQADCGDDGVANVHVSYGMIDDDYLIGRNATTLTIGEGSENFDRRYGISDGYSNLPFTITTSPTTGTCTTTLTDDKTGDVLAEKTSAGKITLTAIMEGAKSD